MIEENKNKYIAEALNNLSTNSEWELQDGKIIEWFTGERPTDAEIDAEVIRLQAEYDAQAYARNRQAEYPPIAEQLDILYHSGVAGLQAELKKTKDKFPKG